MMKGYFSSGLVPIFLAAAIGLFWAGPALAWSYFPVKIGSLVAQKVTPDALKSGDQQSEGCRPAKFGLKTRTEASSALKTSGAPVIRVWARNPFVATTSRVSWARNPFIQAKSKIVWAKNPFLSELTEYMWMKNPF